MQSNTPRITQSNTPRNTQSNTPRITQSNTPRNTPRIMQSNTPRITQSNTPRITQSNTPRITQSNTQSNTPRITQSNTPRNTPRIMQSNTPRITQSTSRITQSPSRIAQSNTPRIIQSNTPRIIQSNTPRIIQSNTPRDMLSNAKTLDGKQVAVVVAFFICWAPFHAQRLVAIYGTDEHHRPRSSLLLHAYTTLTYISGVFYYFSTSINPILYHIMSNKFRDAFKSTLVRCCRAGGHSSQRCSYTTAARNPASSSIDSGNPKDGDKGITRGSKTSLSDKRIKFDFDRNITYYQNKYEQTKIAIAKDINLEEGLKESGGAERNKLAEEVYVVVPEDTSDDDTQLARVTLSDEPEVYIKEIRDRMKRRQKGYG